MDKLSEIKNKIFAVEILQTLKKSYSYNEISNMFQLPIPTLSRYINGHVLPNMERAAEIINFFKEKELIGLVKKKTKRQGNVVDDSRVLCNISLLDKIAKVVCYEFRNTQIDKIMTKETDGVPLAVLTGKNLGVDVLVVKKRKDVAVSDFIEAKISYPSGLYSYIYLPSGEIKKNEKILLIDDIIRTGSTIRGLYVLCKKVGAQVAGVYTIFSLGTLTEKLEKELKVPVKCLVHL